MKAGSPNEAQGDDRNTVQARSTKANPTYIGLRVNRKTPEVTILEAVSGFSGFTVVFACRNAMTPERARPIPVKAIAITVVIRIKPGT